MLSERQKRVAELTILKVLPEPAKLLLDKKFTDEDAEELKRLVKEMGEHNELFTKEMYDYTENGIDRLGEEVTARRADVRKWSGIG